MTGMNSEEWSEVTDLNSSIKRQTLKLEYKYLNTTYKKYT